MTMKPIKIALISPSESIISETFIQQHKKYLAGNVLYYFNGFLPTRNDRKGFLLNGNEKIVYSLKKMLKVSDFSINEQALINSFKKEKIEVVVAEYGQTGVAVLNVCKYLEIPIISIFHGYDASVKKVLNEYSIDYKRLFVYSKRIIAVSNKIRETLINLGCEENKVIVTPCAPDNSFFELKPTFLSQTFFGVGRFVDKKAPYYTILAFYKVLLEFPHAKLLLAGDGPLFNTCANLIKNLGIEDSVKLLGAITSKEVKENLVKATAFVQHSIVALNGDSEGTPVAILEASAAGLPVISTFHAGISDVVINNKTGFLVEEHDIDEMSEKMMLVLGNIDYYKTMGAEGRRNVRENFTKDIHIDIINKAIKLP